MKEQSYHFDQRNQRWVIQRVEYQGQDRLSVWPHYHKDGQWLPCAARFGGGFNMPAHEVSGLVAALQDMFGLEGGDA